MILLQRQGPRECWLASVCMLTDYPLEAIRREIVERFGYSWQAMQQLKRRTGHEGRRNEFSRFVVQKTRAPKILLEANWAYGTTIKRGRAPRLRIPPGRGVIVLVKNRGVNYRTGRRYMDGHIVVFEGGLVYDPASGVLTESLFNSYYRGNRVEKVVQIPRAP